jgi:MFS family permease
MVKHWSTIPRGLVVVAAFTAQLILEGIVLALDVLPPYILRYFKSTNAEVTLFGAVIHGFSHILGPLSSMVANKIGDRILVITCGLTACAGFLLGSLAQHVWQLVLACSLVGISFGMAWVPPVTVVSFHFKKRRHLVTSGTTIGGAVGGAIAPFAFQALLDYHPWQHCFIFMAAIVVQLAVCGALLVRPKNISAEEEAEVEAAVLMEDLTEEEILKAEQENTHEKIAPCMQKLALPMLLICTFVWHVGYDAFEIMPLRLTDEGFTGNVIPLAISLHAVCDIFGRLAAAILVGKLDQAFTYNVFLIIGGVSRVMLSWNGTLAMYIIYICFSGFCFGVVKASAPSVLLKLVGVKRLNNAFGFWLLASGLGGMVGPPFAGYLTDTFDNDYFPAFMVGGICVLAASIPMLPYHWPMKRLIQSR